VVLGAVIALFDALVGANVGAFHASIAFFNINGNGHGVVSEKEPDDEIMLVKLNMDSYRGGSHPSPTITPDPGTR
jgi:hypothetical protein